MPESGLPPNDAVGGGYGFGNRAAGAAAFQEGFQLFVGAEAGGEGGFGAQAGFRRAHLFFSFQGQAEGFFAGAGAFALRGPGGPLSVLLLLPATGGGGPLGLAGAEPGITARTFAVPLVHLPVGFEPGQLRLNG